MQPDRLLTEKRIARKYGFFLFIKIHHWPDDLCHNGPMYQPIVLYLGFFVSLTYMHLFLQE